VPASRGVDEFGEGAARNPLESTVRKTTLLTPGLAQVPRSTELAYFVQWAQWASNKKT
jgi:hypothetical protein